MGYFCLGHDILGVQKSLRVELGGGLPLFTSIREEVFSETRIHLAAKSGTREAMEGPLTLSGVKARSQYVVDPNKDATKTVAPTY